MVDSGSRSSGNREIAHFIVLCRWSGVEVLVDHDDGDGDEDDVMERKPNHNFTLLPGVKRPFF